MSSSLTQPPSGTIRTLLDERARSGGVAIVFPETNDELTWADIRDAAKVVASDLTARGLSKGESVAILQPNGREGVVAFYGCLYGGFRATMINLAAGPDAISYCLEHSEAKIAFVHASQTELFEGAALEGTQFVPVANTATETELFPLAPEDHALLMYTSGTTGRPKGVLHSHASLLAGGWTTAVAHRLTTEDRGFCVLPIYHINGLCVTVISALVSGGSISMVSKFSASRFWEQAAQAEVTWFSVVPTIISHLLHGSSVPAADTKRRIRFGRSASSALAIETQQGFESRFGIGIVETMGLTETAAQILSNPLERSLQKIGSPGTAYGNEARIADPDQNPCPPEVEGEIQVRGPNVMLGYLKNPEATTGTFTGDWLRTGDLGRMDKDGFVYVTGRLKELIIKGGENIAPREIDEALYTHADVVEAAAFARPCKTYGERVEAAVRLCEGSQASADELISICIERVGKFKAPERVHILNDLPKGPSGKIQRMKLAGLISEPAE